MTRTATHRPALETALTIFALALMAAVAAPATEIVFNESCFPTCDTRDGRLLIMAGGPGLQTRSDTPLNLKFHIESSSVAPPADPSFTIEIFDGDTHRCSTAGACDPFTGVGRSHWDIGRPAQVFFTLYAVQEQPDGSSLLTLVDPSKIELDAGAVAATNPFSGGDMHDNDWFRVKVTVGSEALVAGTGDYRYQLKMELDPSVVYGPREGTLNGMKVRTSASLLMSRVEQPFAFEAKWTNVHDLRLIYPNFDLSNPFNPANVAGATYDGSFSFYFHVPPADPGSPRTELSIFDADLDHSNYTGTIVDRDDPDTSGYLSDLPFTTGPEMHPEGESSGAPFDDENPTGLGLYLTRTPLGAWDPANPIESAISYRLFFPVNTDPGTITCRTGDSAPGPVVDGQYSIENLNPSGNQEWEKFTLSTAPFDGSVMDCQVDTIPSGTYRVDLVGMDMNNLNAWFFAGDVCGVRPDGKPLCPGGIFKLGDTVWMDLDADGNGDPAEIAADGENGIPGVIMILEDSAGTEIGRTITDVDGKYEFDVHPGQYTVRVAGENFTGTSTTGVVEDRVWLDSDDDSDEDADESGLNGIEVLLFDAGPDGAVGGGDDKLVATTRTSDDGNFRFDNLPPGTYYVTVAEKSTPPGLTLSGGRTSSTYTISSSSSSESFSSITDPDLDIGFSHKTAGTGVVGDFVWHDLDADGLQDDGEPGLDGVTVALLDDTGAVVQTAVTRGGYYLFSGVAPGIYQVDVTDTRGVLTGYSLTSFNDPTSYFLVDPGAALLAQDFGYYNGALFSISDVVWRDDDRDRVIDGTELGIPGVTVALVGLGGAVLADTTTAADGSFSFDGVVNGAYSVVITDLGGVLADLLPTTPSALVGSAGATVEGASVAAASFGFTSGGALADLRSTTVGDVITDTVVDQNVLTYDFGYAPLGTHCSIGRPTALVFEYVGDSCTSPNADMNRQTEDTCSGPLDGDQPVQVVMTSKPERFIITPSTETIQVGDLVTIEAAKTGDLMWPVTEISIRQRGVEIQHVTLHTSCSENLDPGDQFGSLLLRRYVFP